MYNEVFYQIYPLGMLDCPKENDGTLVHRFTKLFPYAEHLKKLGVTAVWFSPIFESDAHGYDTRDYNKIDVRLGTNEDFVKLCRLFHENNIKVILDGVFNHVGRGFWAFRDVIEKKWDSPYKDWFYIHFEDTWGQDGFRYDNWEGHDELVKLNLRNPEVIQYLLDAVDHWLSRFEIDGLRLDVAYMVDRDFLRTLKAHVKEKNPVFLLIGEMIGGDYNVLLNDCGLDSVTNYECRKGIYSSLNSKNMFEIAYSYNRQFGNDPWTLYKGRQLLSFVDNHDVDRIASILQDKRDLPLAYDLVYAMCGLPCIYYGSEWGIEGKKEGGNDWPLRPSVLTPVWNDLCEHIAALSHLRKAYPALAYGNYTQHYLTNEQFAFSRTYENETIFFAINIANDDAFIRFPAGTYKNLLTGNIFEVQEGISLEAKSSVFLLKK